MDIIDKIIDEEIERFLKEERCWDGYQRNYDVPKGEQGSCEIKKEAATTSDKLQVQSQLRYINQDIFVLEGQKEYYENSVSYSSLTLNIREGSGVSLFSWNYYVQRALNWIESIIGFGVSFGIIAIPLLLIVLGLRKYKSKS